MGEVEAVAGQQVETMSLVLVEVLLAAVSIGRSSTRRLVRPKPFRLARREWVGAMLPMVVMGRILFGKIRQPSMPLVVSSGLVARSRPQVVVELAGQEE